jgi:hypothetical protein
LFSILALAPRPAASQSVTPCDLAAGPAATFPRIPLCAFAGAYRDSSLIDPKKCIGAYHGPLADSLENRARTITLRFRRDRHIEARPDFGGYRIYRVQNYTGTADTSRMVLIRRYSLQTGDSLLWHFSVVDTATLEFKCKNQVVSDSIITFIDPDSSGSVARVCRIRQPQDDPNGRCISIGDSVLILRPPPGPHDGFLTWYAITYEAKNASLDGNYADMFVPDTVNCATPSQPELCPNLNNKLLNLTAEPVEPTGGPTPNLERVIVVPNPFRASAPWDSPGAHELHFINLPNEALIKIYTVAGDLVAELRHSDKIRDFERWNLKNQDGRDVASGIYMYRVEASSFTFQDRFIVIR